MEYRLWLRSAVGIKTISLTGANSGFYFQRGAPFLVSFAERSRPIVYGFGLPCGSAPLPSPAFTLLFTFITSPPFFYLVALDLRVKRCGFHS
jgi:hypothetical protein